MISLKVKWLIRSALVLVLAQASAASAAPCLDWQQSRALATKVIQTRLMVAALSCDQRPSYNSFVTKFDGELVRHNGTLMAWYRQNYGAGGERAYHSLMTRIANESSADHLRGAGYFCRQSAETLQFYLADSSISVASMLSASVTAERFGTQTCFSTAINYEIRGASHRIPVYGDRQ